MLSIGNRVQIVLQRDQNYEASNSFRVNREKLKKPRYLWYILRKIVRIRYL